MPVLVAVRVIAVFRRRVVDIAVVLAMVVIVRVIVSVLQGVMVLRVLGVAVIGHDRIMRFR